uniref:Insulysin n=1 Tax=Chaetoceros debilis TaxID=122233 RepID=A0A7S3Q5Z2_9STRA
MEMNGNSNVLLGPDLNPSRSPLDKKLYRQILLENGLRVVLISDTEAMLHQELYEYDDDDSDDSDGGDGGTGNDTDKKESEPKEEEEDSDSDDSEEEDDDAGLRKAAAALVVGAGSFHDPACANGMAHFLEHMLFMGTSKYPLENQYDAFLSKNSGSDNAYTELEYTLYHMEVCQEAFWKGLDMLAQFFVSPLLLEDCVDRELNAIESEFQLSKNSDECRLQQLLCHDCKLQHVNNKGKGEENGKDKDNHNRHHPFANFSWGNRQSLVDLPKENNIDMMKELRKFYNAHYYAQNMSLVVIGAYSLDKLQAKVVESFSAVPSLPSLPRMDNDEQQTGSTDTNANTNTDAFYASMNVQPFRSNPCTWESKIDPQQTPIVKCGMPFQPTSLNRIIRSIPVKDKHSLSITFQIPPQYQHWESKPCDYISHLLGHEAEGSLLSSLKETSWVNTCCAGVGDGGYENASGHALFCMTFMLTKEGVDHWEEILDRMYMYLGMMRHYIHNGDGLPTWIHEELKSIQEMSHKFEDDATPVDLAESIAECMVPFACLPPERLLDGDALLFKFNGDVIRELVDDYLIPANARVDLTSSTFGRASDFDEHVSNMNVDRGNENHSMNSKSGDAIDFTLETAGEPYTEPIFGMKYWSHPISEALTNQWMESREPKLPPTSSKITLPPVNPFVPRRFDLKDLPKEDSHHPLLFCSLKICVSIGKRKSWFPCTVNKYDSIQNRILLGMEDGEEVWHKVDMKLAEYHKVKQLALNYEGTLDGKKVKFKVISIPKDGEGAVMKYGDESDWHIEDGVHFPHIPPPLPESRLPKLLCNTQLLKLWHLQDRKFKRPIGELRLRIICANANKSPYHRACAELLCLLLHDATIETCYLASVCELENEIYANDVGFTLRVHGFDDRILDLTSEMLKTFFSFCGNTDVGDDNDKYQLPSAVKKHRFDACLEILRRRYGNAGLTASSFCSDIRLRCLRPTIWSASAKAHAIEDIDDKKFMETVADIMSKISIEGLHHGNVDKKDVEMAKEVILDAASGFQGLARKLHPKQQVSVVPQRENEHLIAPTLDPNEANTAVEVYFQCGKDDVRERVIVDLLMEIMYEPMFNQLRTKEQFGYQVSCGSRWTYGVIGMCFKVVTNCKSADEVTARIDKFIAEYRSELVSMKPETFMEHVVGLAKDKLQRFNSLEEEAGSLWAEIVEGRYDFEVHRNEAEVLRQLSKENLIETFDKYLLPPAPSTTPPPPSSDTNPSTSTGANGKKKRKKKKAAGNFPRKLTVKVIGTAEGEASKGRPDVAINVDDEKEDVAVADVVDGKVMEFLKTTKNQTWGKIY